MSAPRRILLVAYYYPPQNIIGARRPAALAKWLRRRGHDVTVLTTLRSGRGPDAAPSRLLRTRDLLCSPLNWRADSGDVVTGKVDADWDPDPGFWGKIAVPDIQLVSWLPFAVGAALRLHRRFAFDCVVTTSPVESVHLTGLALQRRGAAWVADLRDGWRFEAPRGDWPLAFQRLADDALERAVLRRADGIVMVTEPLAADLRRRHGLAVATITNGFDPDDAVPANASPAPRVTDAAKLTFAHTGGLGERQTLRPLLEALVRVAADAPELAGRVELILAGQQMARQRELYGQPQFAPFVRHIGFVPRPSALALQRAADVLVLVTSGVRTGEATGKLFEYLATGKPILLLGAGSAAADIVADAGAGIVVAVGDTAATEVAVRRILAGDLPTPAPEARSAYAYPALAARYEQVIERAIAARAAPASHGVAAAS